MCMNDHSYNKAIVRFCQEGARGNVVLSLRSVAEARRRVAAQTLIECGAIVLADAQDLPLAGGAFDDGDTLPL